MKKPQYTIDDIEIERPTECRKCHSKNISFSEWKEPDVYYVTIMCSDCHFMWREKTYL